ncbi:ribonuclease Y [bacterium]|nr:ribonuclease Y [bacterium]
MLTLMIEVGVGILVFWAGWFLHKFYFSHQVQKASMRAKDIIEQAKREARKERNRILLNAKEERFKIRESLQKEFRSTRKNLENLEKKLAQKEKSLESREDSLIQKENRVIVQEREVGQLQQRLKSKEAELDRILEARTRELEKIAQLTVEEAKEQLIESIREETRLEAVKMTKAIIEEARENATREAKRIITDAIERIASDHTVETTVSVVNLPSDEIKGRIIGRDGRNIRTFETITGVKVIVDDTPEAVVLSAFDPVKRETARLALEKLLKTNKINPQHIEQVIKQSEKEMEQFVWQAGNEAVKELGIGSVRSDLIKILGRLKYRTSYGQNVLQHSKEVAHLAGAMAAELGFDVKLAKRAGLFHDIGKAVSQGSEGTHTQIGVELMKKFNEHPVVINAIASHHEDEEATSPISVLVAAADAVSGSRPGARRETLEGYVRRIERLEKLADSFEGVAKAFAISAGREIRVIVKPEKMSDEKTFLLASDIAKKIQSDMEYPGQIKVTVIRETRAIQYV